jgi:hypothetical protein
MGLWAKLFGLQKKTGAGTSQGVAQSKGQTSDLMKQRQALAERLLTPERQERLAQAMQVQAAKQRLNRNLGSENGQQHLAGALRELLKKD